MLNIFRFAGRILMVLKIAIPVIIIFLGSIDLGKAITSNDDDAIKKSTATLIRRTILGVLIFFLPTIVNIIFSLVPGARSSIVRTCYACLYRPNSC